MEVTEPNKTQILLALLERRYENIEKIRNSVYNISIWILGVFLAAASLIVKSSLQLDLPEKIFLAVAAVFALAVILLYIKDLERGFRNQFRVAIRIEKLLGLYSQGFFCPDERLYPSEWANTGTRSGRGRFFAYIYVLLCLGAAFLLAAIGLSGLWF